MSQEIFQSDRYFTVFNLACSHGMFLIRSQKNEISNENVDIIFSDVAYMQLFWNFKGLSIHKIDVQPDHIQYSSVKKYLEYDNNNLFEIQANGELYYIAASFVQVYVNGLDFSESSLDFNINRGTQIASSVSD